MIECEFLIFESLHCIRNNILLVSFSSADGLSRSSNCAIFPNWHLRAVLLSTMKVNVNSVASFAEDDDFFANGAMRSPEAEGQRERERGRRSGSLIMSVHETITTTCLCIFALR